MDLQKIEELARCPVCLDLPPNEIFQCPLGHLICKKCCSKLTLCPQPQCRMSLGTKIRSRAVELILNEMPLECPNKPLGCQTILVRGDLAHHVKICKFNKALVNICKMIGFQSCEKVVNTQLISAQFLRHLNGVHGVVVIGSPGPQVKLQHEGFRKSCNLKTNLETIWTPVLLNVKTNGFTGFDQNERFLIYSLMKTETDTISWSCLHLSDSPDGPAPLVAEFSIKSPSPQIPTLTCNTPVVEIRVAENMLFRPFQLSTKLLADHYVTSGLELLTVNVTIAKKSEDTKDKVTERDMKFPCVRIYASAGQPQRKRIVLDGFKSMYSWIQKCTGNGVVMSSAGDYLVKPTQPNHTINGTNVGHILTLLALVLLYSIAYFVG